MRWLIVAAAICWVAPVRAQTWTGQRSTPVIDEIVAIDATGEVLWPYGSEDIAGDGATFMQQEQSIDMRTAYAVADSSTFWARVYVSDGNAPGGNVRVFVFVDSDRNAATGGGADATDIDERFTTDPSDGGYEYVIEVGGNATIDDIWEWSGSQFQPLNLNPNQANAEADRDRDPIDIGIGTHGYLQAMVALDVVGLTASCDADLFFRSLIDGGSGDGDLDVGAVAPCIPVDSDDDGVPDIVEPDGCDDDDNCPAGGICINGECYIPDHCIDDGDCNADEVCDDGICRPVGGGSCADDADCDGIFCDDGTCAPCTPGGDECGPGRVCAPDGRCIDGESGGLGGGDGLGLQPGDNIQGGAFTCAMASDSDAWWALAWLSVAAGLLAHRRRGRHAA